MSKPREVARKLFVLGINRDGVINIDDLFSYKENRFVACEKVPSDTSNLVNHRPCSFPR